MRVLLLSLLLLSVLVVFLVSVSVFVFVIVVVIGSVLLLFVFVIGAVVVLVLVLVFVLVLLPVVDVCPVVCVPDCWAMAAPDAKIAVTASAIKVLFMRYSRCGRISESAWQALDAPAVATTRALPLSYLRSPWSGDCPIPGCAR